MGSKASILGNLFSQSIFRQKKTRKDELQSISDSPQNSRRNSVRRKTPVELKLYIQIRCRYTTRHTADKAASRIIDRPKPALKSLSHGLSLSRLPYNFSHAHADDTIATLCRLASPLSLAVSGTSFLRKNPRILRVYVPLLNEHHL